MLPLSRAGSLSHGKKRLLLFAALYGVLTAVGSAFTAAGGDLDENRVQLRMMIGAFYPFLLIPIFNKCLYRAHVWRISTTPQFVKF